MYKWRKVVCPGVTGMDRMLLLFVKLEMQVLGLEGVIGGTRAER